MNFRHLLERHHLAQEIFSAINRTLSDRGLFLKAGTIVDARLISAASSTKNESQSRDPEMHTSKKGNQLHVGSKFHVGVDHERGLVHTVKVSSGHVSDIAVAAELLHEEEQFI